MDKKNVIIGGLVAALGYCLYALGDLAERHNALVKIRKDEEEMVKEARSVVTEIIFQDIVENFDR